AVRAAGGRGDVERIRAAAPQSAVGAGDADEGVDVRRQPVFHDLARGQGDAHRVADDVDLAGARAGDGFDQCVEHRGFFTAVVVVAGRTRLAAPVGAQDLAVGQAAGAKLDVGVVELRGRAGVAVHQHHRVAAGRRGGGNGAKRDQRAGKDETDTQ